MPSQRPLRLLGTLSLVFAFLALLASSACAPEESASVFDRQSNPLAAKNVPWLQGTGDDSGGSGLAHSVVDTDLSIYAVGVFSGTSDFPGIGAVTSAGEKDLFVGRIDPGNGAFLWHIKGGSTLGDHANRVAVDSDGLYVTGTLRGNGLFGTASYTCPNACSFLAKLAKSSGAITWFKLFSTTNNGTSQGVSLAPYGSHLYAVGAFTGLASYESKTVQSGYDIAKPYSATNPYTNNASADAYILKVNKADGTVVWLRRAGGNLNDSAADLYVDANFVHVLGTYTRKMRFERRDPLVPAATENENYLTIEVPTSTHPTSAVRLFFAKFVPSTGNIATALHGGGGTYAQPAAQSCTQNSDCTNQTLCSTSLGQCYVPSFEHTYVYSLIPHRGQSTYFYVAGAFSGNVSFGNLNLSSGALANRDGLVLRIRNLGAGIFESATHLSSASLDSVQGLAFFSDPTNSNRDRLFASGRRIGSGDYDAFLARIIPSTMALNRVLTFGTSGKDSASTVAAAPYNPSDPSTDFLFFGGAFQGPLTLGSNSIPFSGSPDEDAFWGKITRPLCGYTLADPC